jgi:hypothetical protein
MCGGKDALPKMKCSPISISQAVNFAWIAFKRHYGLFAAALLTIIGAWVALEVLVFAGQRLGFLWWAIAHLAFLTFFAGMQVGIIRMCLALYDGGQPTFADLFSVPTLWPIYLAGQLLYLALVAIGLVLMVVPGVYLAVRYALFGFRIATGETTLQCSFQESAALTAGTRTYLLGILIALFLLNVLGASVLGLGLFITVPLSVLTMTAVYRQLRAR